MKTEMKIEMKIEMKNYGVAFIAGHQMKNKLTKNFQLKL
jgi:hypothetical protein